jgi:hypothetical protein
MRMLMTVQVDTEAGNKGMRDGSFPQTLERALGELQPEAAYFGARDGKRTGYIVFDLKDPSDIPSVAEPLFLGFNASIELVPVMTMQDVQTGLEKASAAFAAA